MLRKLYDWTLEKVSGPNGERWLAILSVAEAVFFPVPVDVMLLPMMLADHSRVWRLAFITTVASIVGALIGYLIGAFLYEAVAQPLLAFYGYEEAFQRFNDYYQDYGIAILLVAGLTPIPFKVAAISSGVFGLNPLLFILMCIPARAPRFYVEAALLYYLGPSMKDFIETYLTWIAVALIMIGILGFLVLKWV